MAFVNPYGDPWDAHIAAGWIRKLMQTGVRHIAISDTVGYSKPESIHNLFSLVISEFPSIEFGFHLHTNKRKLHEKVNAAWEAGCRNFDSVLSGVGGCPLSGYELVGNLDTVELVSFFRKRSIEHHLNEQALHEAMQIAADIFTAVKKDHQ
jgi:hydroxymethylglutaryl-CoA lyase